MPQTTTIPPMILINAIGDGNCGYNSFAIWFALHYLGSGPSFIDERHQEELENLLNECFTQYPIYRNTEQTVQDNFHDFLRNNDLSTIQTTLAPVFRSHSVTCLQQMFNIQHDYFIRQY